MRTSDMIVPLYQSFEDPFKDLPQNFQLRRAFKFEYGPVTQWAEKFCPHWTSEYAAAFNQAVPSIWIATKSGRIVGACAYDVVARAVVGPLAATRDGAKLAIGRRLLVQSLISLKYDGYAYAVLGWVAPRQQRFFSRFLKTYPIPDSQHDTGMYSGAISL